MKVLVAGSSSVLGRHIIKELRAQSHSVRALTRDASRVKDLGADEVAVGDALHPATLTAACDGVDAVISSIGASVLPDPRFGIRGFYAIDWPANKHLIDAAIAAGVKKLVYVSVFGGRESRHLAYCDAHEKVVDYARARGLDVSVLRPTAFFSALKEFVQMANAGLVPVFGEDNRSNPVHDADLAAACVNALGPGEQHVDVGGPDVLSRRAMAELAIAANGNRARVLSLPPFVLRIAALVSFALPRIRQILSFFAHVMSRDLIAPVAGTRRLSVYFDEVAKK